MQLDYVTTDNGKNYKYERQTRRKDRSKTHLLECSGEHFDDDFGEELRVDSSDVFDDGVDQVEDRQLDLGRHLEEYNVRSCNRVIVSSAIEPSNDRMIRFDGREKN
jgi:hypothetical protein